MPIAASSPRGRNGVRRPDCSSRISPSSYSARFPAINFWTGAGACRSGSQDGSFVFHGFVSSDGNNWEQIGTEVHIAMGAHALAGIAVTAHTDPPNDHLQDLCVSVIDRVSFS